MNRRALKYMSDRCFINIIPHLILFPISIYLKGFLTDSLCFIFRFSLSFSLLSICSVAQSLCSLSGLLLEDLFSLLFSPSVSPPPHNSTLRCCCNRAHTHIFFPSDPVSMYSLGVHLHTTHYVTSFLLPISLFHSHPLWAQKRTYSPDVSWHHVKSHKCFKLYRSPAGKRGIPNIIQTQICFKNTLKRKHESPTQTLWPVRCRLVAQMSCTHSHESAISSSPW